MKIFNFYIPTKIFFGSGILESTLKDEASKYGSNIMLVTGKSAMRKYGHTDKILKALSQSGIQQVITFENISSNPKITEINEAVNIGIKYNVNLIIGLGGGSVIDAAKAIAVGIGHKETLEKYLLNGKVPSKATLPIIAIPTTAGTGAEVSKGAILTSKEHNLKSGIRGEYLYPKIAIVDPSLTLEIPDRITKETGFDVLAHAIETYISKSANPITETLSIEAIKIVAEYLPILVKNPQNLNAREKLSYASLLMGVNLGNSSTCLPHRLQYPLGAYTDMGHGEGLVCLYKAWLRNTYINSKEKFNIIGTILSNSKIKCATIEQVINAYECFMNSIGLKRDLRDFGITIKDIDKYVNGVSGNISSDPGANMENIIKLIYIESLEEE